MGWRELKGYIISITGIFLVIGGTWLIWDWINSIVHFLDWTRFKIEWRFPAPLFIYWWDWTTWTGPFDTGLAMIVLGLILYGVGAYYVGKIKA